MPSPDTVVFVCQAGEIEVKAALLAVSLRDRLGPSPNLVAAVPMPEDTWGRLDTRTRTLFEQIGVETRPIENPFQLDYPHGNKIVALGAVKTSGMALFLDSDILCLRAPEAWDLTASFNAKPADLATWGKTDQDWMQLYGTFGLKPPARRVLTTVSGILSPPYYNAGVLALTDAPAFADCWLDTCTRLDRDPSIEDKRPWLDQIGLPVTIARLALDHRALGSDYNFPAHLMPLPQRLPILCHYHWPVVIRREPRLLESVRALMARYPLLAGLVQGAGEDWCKVLGPAPTPRPRTGLAVSFGKLFGTQRGPRAAGTPPPEIIISGLPRSGTSLLCRLLDDQPNSVIVNEPRAIFEPLRNGSEPHWIACFHRDLRRAILEGEAIENRVVDGRLVEDTRVEDVRDAYRPQVSGPDFLLGTKNTLAYLSRIGMLRRSMPEAPIVACVRHPMDTIASWKGSFAHLREASLSGFPAGFANPAFLTLRQQEGLRTITETPSATQRRALLWAYLADIVIEHLDSLVLLRYEDLTTNVEAEVKRILDAVPGFTAAPVRRQDLAPRTRRDLLDDEDYRAIEDICRPQAECFGYSL